MIPIDHTEERFPSSTLVPEDHNLPVGSTRHPPASARPCSASTKPRSLVHWCHQTASCWPTKEGGCLVLKHLPLLFDIQGRPAGWLGACALLLAEVLCSAVPAHAPLLAGP
ncbi:hypothetical protein AAFF_G00039560 [Aldrovandia affinis]|uniref:Uncharacterized protein n=1 Tax=Aldrovandia affinis TaxID=143900 RepID=A0AAD7S2V8_9TELE|nr:hypothetical protein AAFF_G00039560 [Aldrovandia affinis]